jgi:hypothetical protein
MRSFGKHSILAYTLRYSAQFERGSPARHRNPRYARLYAWKRDPRALCERPETKSAYRCPVAVKWKLNTARGACDKLFVRIDLAAKYVYYVSRRALILLELAYFFRCERGERIVDFAAPGHRGKKLARACGGRHEDR